MKTKFLILLSAFCFLITENNFSQTINTVAGTGAAGSTGDGAASVLAKLSNPCGVTMDAAGNVYIVENSGHRVRKINTFGIISTIAGTGAAGFSGDGGLATAAKLNAPTGVAVDAAGNIYISDRLNMRIRKIDNMGIISTIAGTGTSGFSGDGGLATAAKLNWPFGVVVNSLGDVYIADTGNNRIRKIDHTTNNISTIAGTGTQAFNADNIAATTANISVVKMGLDAAQDLYVADCSNNRIRKITISTGLISTVAGTGAAGFGGDGAAATAAQLNYPSGVTFDLSGNMYITDMNNQRIRKIDIGTGNISTIAGVGTAGFSGDGGLPTAAQFSSPQEASVDASGNLYIADQGNHRARAIINIVLPIELLTFTGKNKENVNVLEWSTASEINNDYFTLERSVDGENFENIAKVTAVGNSNSNNNYNFYDSNLDSYRGSDLTSNIYYYRLKQTDLNGAFTYSQIISISRTQEGIELTNVYPNPATDHFNFTINSVEETILNLNVIDMLGRVVKTQQNVNITKGSNTLSVDVSDLNRGSYFLQVVTSSDVYKVEKLVSLK